MEAQIVVKENYRIPWRKRRCVNVSACRCSFGYSKIGFQRRVGHEELTFDASQTSEGQWAPPSYGTTAGKRIVWGERLAVYILLTGTAGDQKICEQLEPSPWDPRGV